MRIIGLTGGIASGKSTVSEVLQKYGAVILDADKVAWQLAEPDGSIWQAYFDRYGSAVINEDRSLNRQAVADRVFSDKNELAWMNEMAHPLIKTELMHRLERLRHEEQIQKTELVVILDVPLLFESGWHTMADETWLVYTSRSNQIARLKSRNGIEEAEAVRRISSQMDMEKKRELADYIIDNNDSYEALLNHVNELWEKRIGFSGTNV